jgi:elongation factor P
MPDGQLYSVVDRQLKTPGNLPSKLWLTLKNLKTGFTNDQRVHPDDKVEKAELDTRVMQYLYRDGEDHIFMDTETFDQGHLRADLLGDLIKFLKEGDKTQVVFHEGNPISIELPASVQLRVVDTEPAIKGATATAQYKAAKLETGLEVQVPPFIGRDEMILVDTRTGEYLSRVKG